MMVKIANYKKKYNNVIKFRIVEAFVFCRFIRRNLSICNYIKIFNYEDTESFLVDFFYIIGANKATFRLMVSVNPAHGHMQH